MSESEYPRNGQGESPSDQSSTTIRPHDNLWRYLKHWQSTLTVLAFAVSVASASFSCQQAANGRRQAVAAEGSRDAAEKSAQAAARSAGVAERSLEQTLNEIRPRLSVTMANVTPLVAGRKPSIEWLVKNEGRAAATKINHRVWAQLLDERAKAVPHPETESTTTISLAQGAIIPGAKLLNVVTQPEIDQINSGRKALFVYGVLEYWYKDVRREIQWCSVYTSEKPVSFGMLPACQFHNSSD